MFLGGFMSCLVCFRVFLGKTLVTQTILFQCVLT